jgi:hypothetical protein
MNDQYFPGQQEDERVLHIITPHPIAEYSSIAKLVGISLLLLVSLLFLGKIHPIFPLLGIVLALVVFVVGSLIVHTMHEKNIAYVTDRRIVRFESSNLFTTNSRSLSWDDTVKVKTFAPNFLWRMFNIGTVTVHAKTTLIHINSSTQQNTVTNDDLDLHDVYYYRDLGNYIDKILYLNKHNPAELSSLRAFVPKPKGQRY